MDSVFQACIDRIEEDVEKALADSTPSPYISVGGSKTQQPHEVIVREVVTDVDISDVVTSAPVMGRVRGSYFVTFAVEIQMWAKQAVLTDASSAVNAWFERIVSAIGADKTLGGACRHAEPYFSTSGTAFNSPKYIAAIDAGVRVKVEIPFSKE